MAWYNEVKNMEENVSSYFENKHISLGLLSELIRQMEIAEKNKKRTLELTMKENPTQKQLSRHESNCKHFEFRAKLVQFCINELSNDY